ncbi:MAG: trypco2 family protein [Desulfobacterales bacterium]
MSRSYKITLWLFICVVSILSWSGRSYGAYFEIDDILDALKKEIQTAQAAAKETRRFEIEKVELQLSVSSNKASNGEVKLEVVGSDYNGPVQPKITQSYHRIYLSFYPNDFITFPAELSSGLVEVIKNAIDSLNKSYLSPPSFNFDTFTFDVVFAIVKWKNGEIKFVTTNLGQLISSSIPTHRLTVHMSITNSGNS